MLGVIHALTEKILIAFSDRAIMLREGWKTNNVYWWFEDSGQMTFSEAIDLYREVRGKK